MDYPIHKQLLEKVVSGWVTEHKFHNKRRWRFDFAHPIHMIAVEIEGGVWIKGRHTRGSGFVKDMEKYNSAEVSGWTVLRFTPDQTSEMVDTVTALLLRDSENTF